MDIRKRQKAFHPNASRLNLNLGQKIYGFKRISKDKKQTILCITNLSSKIQKVKFYKKNQKMKNLLKSKNNTIYKKFIILNPFETVWLSNIK